MLGKRRERNGGLPLPANVSNSISQMRIVDLACRPNARHRLVMGLAAGVVVFLVARGPLRFASAAIAGWNAFAVVILALDWVIVLATPQRKIRERRSEE